MSKRPVYMEGVEFIALNDNEGADEAMDAKSLVGHLTVALLAALYDRERATVAADVVKFRKKHLVRTGVAHAPGEE